MQSAAPLWVTYVTMAVAAYAALASTLLTYAAYRAGGGQVVLAATAITVDLVGEPRAVVQVQAQNKGRTAVQLREFRILLAQTEPWYRGPPAWKLPYVVVPRKAMQEGPDLPCTLAPGHGHAWKVDLVMALRQPRQQRRRRGALEKFRLPISSSAFTCEVGALLGDGSGTHATTVRRLKWRHFRALAAAVSQTP